MRVLPTAIQGVSVVETQMIEDPRGSFARLFCQQELHEILGPRKIVQINQSTTRQPGAVRGMHYQHPPSAEMKLVRCLKGRVWDVAIDLREGSTTFLQWHGEELSADNAKMLVIPEGCAHGFQVLETDSQLLYLHTEFYAPDTEDGVAYNDPKLAISWPLPVTGLSERDRDLSPLSIKFSGLSV